MPRGDFVRPEKSNSVRTIVVRVNKIAALEVAFSFLPYGLGVPGRGKCACSSGGKSSGLIIHWSGVRLPLGAPIQFAEATMPSKQDVRDWQQGRIKERKPPPDAKTIRRQLGWDITEAEREEQARKEFPVRIDPTGYKS